ncbi:hypothetical protein IAR55_005530 [Kwoniella newhampshirensis]|uniref:Uncharacterized protein n=1 Tax=Kwoniella newhampshirensis TaxID=1651941 RepID=A0AAW0YIR5_9TREE
MSTTQQTQSDSSQNTVYKPTYKAHVGGLKQEFAKEIGISSNNPTSGKHNEPGWVYRPSGKANSSLSTGAQSSEAANSLPNGLKRNQGEWEDVSNLKTAWEQATHEKSYFYGTGGNDSTANLSLAELTRSARPLKKAKFDT